MINVKVYMFVKVEEEELHYDYGGDWFFEKMTDEMQHAISTDYC
jgi:hypothetical protein